jgi:hypothetical protein
LLNVKSIDRIHEKIQKYKNEAVLDDDQLDFT